jgi:hypothetical protein
MIGINSCRIHDRALAIGASWLSPRRCSARAGAQAAGCVQRPPSTIAAGAGLHPVMARPIGAGWSKQQPRAVLATLRIRAGSVAEVDDRERLDRLPGMCAKGTDGLTGDLSNPDLAPGWRGAGGRDPRTPLLSLANAEPRERRSKLGLLDAGIGKQGPVVARLPPHDRGETHGGLLDPFVTNVRIDHGQERANLFEHVRCDDLRGQIGSAPARPPGSEAARAIDQLAEKVSAVGRHVLCAQRSRNRGT